MATIIGVGIATVDIINVTDGFPGEDTEVRALRQQVRRGGNCANTLVVLSQLGHHCHWLGTMSDDLNSDVIRNDLAAYRVDVSCSEVIPGSTPTSYITLNQRNGSRTIVHYRDLPELSASAIAKAPLQTAHWIHFEGRNVSNCKKMLDHVKHHYPGLPISLEIEKPRDQLDQLFPGADIYFFSRAFAQAQQFDSAQALLQHYRHLTGAALLVCSWGEQGAYALEHDQLWYAPAPRIEPVIDTIGAGDTFHAGFIDARLRGSDIPTALQAACALAAKKCAMDGFTGLVNGP